MHTRSLPAKTGNDGYAGTLFARQLRVNYFISTEVWIEEKKVVVKV